MDYTPDKSKIAKRIARFFKSGDIVNLGIGLPTEVANYIPSDVIISLHSENGFLGLGPAPKAGEEDWDLVNAGGMPVTILPGGAFFDSAMSFAIIRGGHLDYTVLGVLEVDQLGNLANYKVPGKLIPGMGGAMDLTVGAKKVIAATLHFDKGQSKLVKRCSLPLTAKGEVDYVVTDLGLFTVEDGKFVLQEYFKGCSPEFIIENTPADIIISPNCKEVEV
ncbi:MAG: 3-oxoacid CoA-transferase subunit B [Spirochaetes bacterium]|nr:3-oxoacid CoA-transferase subunit B [Spirochaetota bacterium]NLJ05453.1 3-oxoacid CoA-transferase subunit B [Exilispira sp.]MBP8991784.1 3-oxoacid CoA-transferase subunit B [Spirochaetota bacterium]HOV46109.1 3-oxoacid CoA-transferase subunit B [Exilispira sp.]HQM89108.1 3-oxoacid CoA-transferase subunit B [Exilispira sp.]